MTNTWNTANIFPLELSDAQETITEISPDNKGHTNKDISKDTHDRYNDTQIFPYVSR